MVNGSNNVELSALTAAQIDWSNNFLPGINQLVSGLGGQGGYGFQTYYKGAPYMLSANTAWLEPNTTQGADEQRQLPQGCRLRASTRSRS